MALEDQYAELKTYFHWPFGVNMPVWFELLPRKLSPVWDWKGRADTIEAFRLAKMLEKK